jgi:hypothetical protein
MGRAGPPAGSTTAPPGTARRPWACMASRRSRSSSSWPGKQVAEDQAQRRRHRRLPRLDRGRTSSCDQQPGTSCKQLSWWEPRYPTTTRVEDLAGRCWHARPQPQAPPTNSALVPTTAGEPFQSGATSLASPLAPGGLSACLGVHRPLGPRAGRAPGQAFRRGSGSSLVLAMTCAQPASAGWLPGPDTAARYAADGRSRSSNLEEGSPWPSCSM